MLFTVPSVDCGTVIVPGAPGVVAAEVVGAAATVGAVVGTAGAVVAVGAGGDALAQAAVKVAAIAIAAKARGRFMSYSSSAGFRPGSTTIIGRLGRAGQFIPWT